ncbi:BMP family ABC transporter substrate-binding protein [Serpentinicella alkaliphila]|uniref:Nucleoside-binding protein n=1 Tax=Serpentinicella alkaliphila TaxID=1734049 RepID=A0A4R2SX04_9FIRM|nr:BMP family ABC transporter substrate-binding protein [Serpentinicella alkaliphila]QUH27145.1 BMP family ABC transporter substrate-binding protein [Serpentinicella alkaliphila]TCP95039.1 nucleoside-binding protein [Serpentinicella alkaliphila]
MKKVLSLVLIMVMIAALLITGCTSQKADAPKVEDKNEQIKVGFIYVGPIGDGGWTYAHNEGRKYLEEQLNVETFYKESVPEGPEVEKVMRDMIDQGATVIFATSFGYMDYMEKVSKEFPDVKFIHCSGYKMTENMSNYFGRIYQARYLSGIVAGLKTESNKIGYVAAFNIPEVIRGINAFTLGVQSVNPDAVVSVKWTNTWYDPAKEKEAAIALLDEGADVIAQHQDTAGPQIAAEERGKWSVGYNTDMKDTAPKAYMTAPIWNWGPYYVDQVQAIMEGTWEAKSYWGGMDEGIVELAPLTENAPAEAKALVEKAQEEIIAGTQKIFVGPIKDQTGEVKVPDGVMMTDVEMLSFDWFVQGVEGNVK